MGVVHLISVRHAALGETKTKMLLQGLLFGILVNTISSVPAPGHFFHHGYHGYHGYHPKCTTELEAVTKTLCRIEVEKECETKTKTYTKITGYEDTDSIQYNTIQYNTIQYNTIQYNTPC